jgi:hypothetical protein
MFPSEVFPLDTHVQRATCIDLVPNVCANHKDTVGVWSYRAPELCSAVQHRGVLYFRRPFQGNIMELPPVAIPPELRPLRPQVEVCTW